MNSYPLGNGLETKNLNMLNMHKLESILENKMPKILLGFETQKHYPI